MSHFKPVCKYTHTEYPTENTQNNNKVENSQNGNNSVIHPPQLLTVENTVSPRERHISISNWLINNEKTKLELEKEMMIETESTLDSAHPDTPYLLTKSGIEMPRKSMGVQHSNLSFPNILFPTPIPKNDKESEKVNNQEINSAENTNETNSVAYDSNFQKTLNDWYIKWFLTDFLHEIDELCLSGQISKSDLLTSDPFALIFEDTDTDIINYKFHIANQMVQNNPKLAEDIHKRLTFLKNSRSKKEQQQASSNSNAKVQNNNNILQTPQKQQQPVQNPPPKTVNNSNNQKLPQQQQQQIPPKTTVPPVQQQQQQQAPKITNQTQNTSSKNPPPQKAPAQKQEFQQQQSSQNQQHSIPKTAQNIQKPPNLQNLPQNSQNTQNTLNQQPPPPAPSTNQTNNNPAPPPPTSNNNSSTPLDPRDVILKLVDDNNSNFRAKLLVLMDSLSMNGDNLHLEEKNRLKKEKAELESKNKKQSTRIKRLEFENQQLAGKVAFLEQQLNMLDEPGGGCGGKSGNEDTDQDEQN